MYQQYCNYGGYPYLPCPTCVPPAFPKKKVEAERQLQKLGELHPSAHLVVHANRMTKDLENIIPTCAAFMCNSYGFGVDGGAFSERLHVLNDHYKDYRQDARDFINSMEQPPADKIRHPQPVFNMNEYGYTNMEGDVNRHLNDFVPIPSFKFTWPTAKLPAEDEMQIIDVTKELEKERKIIYKRGDADDPTVQRLQKKLAARKAQEKRNSELRSRSLTNSDR